jgi:anti-anti-sigma factor
MTGGSLATDRSNPVLNEALSNLLDLHRRRADQRNVGIKFEEYGVAAVIAPDGDFIGPDVLAARRALNDWLDGTAVNAFVFDISKSGFIDSQGLEALTFTADRICPRGGRVVLAGPNDNCRKILEMTRLDRRFEMFPSADAAVTAIRDGAHR